ncbi:MAG: hypothetical protein AAGU76_13955 [Sedimentibacter sp.]|uniref:hypothetical protein n=1 Tax=Sedimentibacter sp. TaxID=1960295 RepID=UPI003158F410
MEILFGIFVFFVFIAAAFKIGVVMFKILFTLIGAVIGFVLIIALIPVGIGFLLIPAIIIGIIAAVIKCIQFIF